MQYLKMKKSELIDHIKKLESELKKTSSSEEEFNKLKNKYNILKSARTEDKDKIAEAEKIIKTAKIQEQQLAQYYGQQIASMKKTLNEQNETIVNLFDLLEETRNLNGTYYKKYKSIFLSEKKEG